jgi:hypothetical protein
METTQNTAETADNTVAIPWPPDQATLKRMGYVVPVYQGQHYVCDMYGQCYVARGATEAEAIATLVAYVGEAELRRRLDRAYGCDVL